MDMKFTPGPWIVEQYMFEKQFPEGMPVVSEDGRGWFCKSHEIKAMGKRVAEVVWYSNHSHHASKTIEELVANAHLIAAAPAMYEALRAYEKWEAELLNTDAAWSNGLPRFTQELYDKWMELQAKRNTALRKAEGRG